MDNQLIINEQLKKDLKAEFQSINGTEDAFITIVEDENINMKVNGKKGIFKVKEKGREEYELNIFQAIDSLEQFAETLDSLEIMPFADPARPGSWKTQGADAANLRVVKGSTRDTITAWHPLLDGKPVSKTYTKPTSGKDYWYSGYTKGYYDNVGEARKCFGTYRSSMGGVSIAVIMTIAAAYVSVGGVLNPTATAVANFIIKQVGGSFGMGAAINAAGHLIAYLGHISVVNVNYSRL